MNEDIAEHVHRVQHGVSRLGSERSLAARCRSLVPRTFEMSDATIYSWLRQDRIGRGEAEGATLERLRAQLQALPTRELTQLDEVRPASEVVDGLT
jgi:hypothetical protein